nr:helix-turn-helix domain-containing protein [Pseudoalteromonas sp. WY3]
MKKTLRYNYRLNPTPEQEAKLVEFGATARGIWNLLLSENMRRYEHDKTFFFTKTWPHYLKISRRSKSLTGSKHSILRQLNKLPATWN